MDIFGGNTQSTTGDDFTQPVQVVGTEACIGAANDKPVYLVSNNTKRIKISSAEPVTVLDSGTFGVGLSASKVILSGGDPTNVLEATPKQYVDAQVGGITYDQALNTTDNVTFNQATVTTDVQVNGNITVQGDVTVNGVTTTLNTQNLEVKDKQILLNDGEPGGGVSNGTGQAGILIDRGTENDVEMIFDDADNDTWKFRNAVTGTLSNVDTGNLDINGTLTTSGISTLNSCLKVNCSTEDDGIVIRRTSVQDSGILFQNSGNSYTQRLRHTGTQTLELQSGINTTPDNLPTVLSVEGTNSVLSKNWKHANDGTGVGLTLQTLDNLNPTGLAFQNSAASYTAIVQREDVGGDNADLVVRCGLNANPYSLPETMRINNGQVTIVPDLNVGGLLTATRAQLQSHMNSIVIKPNGPGETGTGTIVTSGGVEIALVYSGGNIVSGSINPYIGLGPETNLPDFQFSVIKINKNDIAPPGIPVQDFSDTFYTPATIAYVGAFVKTFDAEYRVTITSNSAGSGRFVVKLDKQDTFGPQEIPITVIDQPLLNGVPTVYHTKFRLYSLAPTSRLTFHFQTTNNESITLDEVQFSFTQLLI